MQQCCSAVLLLKQVHTHHSCFKGDLLQYRNVWSHTHHSLKWVSVTIWKIVNTLRVLCCFIVLTLLLFLSVSLTLSLSLSLSLSSLSFLSCCVVIGSIAKTCVLLPLLLPLLSCCVVRQSTSSSVVESVNESVNGCHLILLQAPTHLHHLKKVSLCA